MVATAVAGPDSSAPPEGVPSVTANVSSPSKVSSGVTAIRMVLLVSSGAKVSVPEAAS
jgi:hypothetical protein